jgi:hypothetical protein
MIACRGKDKLLFIARFGQEIRNFFVFASVGAKTFLFFGKGGN